MRYALNPLTVVLATAATAAMATLGAQYAIGQDPTADTEATATVTTPVPRGADGTMLVLDTLPECGPESDSDSPTDWTMCVYPNGDPWEIVQAVTAISAWKAPDGTQHTAQVTDDVVPCAGTPAPALPGGTAGNPLTRCYWDQTARGVILPEMAGSRYVIATVAHTVPA